MHPVHTIGELFRHNDWARDRVLAACTGLDDAQLDRKFEMGIGSLRGTLHHVWAAERIWLDRWVEKPDVRFQEPESGISVAELGRRYRETAAERDELLIRIGHDGLRRRITYTNLRGQTLSFPIGDMAMHVANHGVHHRAQTLNMLKQLGVAPPKIDYIFMRLEAGSPTDAALEADTLGEYFRYGDWAMARVLKFASALAAAQLDHPFDMGLGSLRRTLLHIRDAEQWWFENWSGNGSVGIKATPETTSITELQQLFSETARRRNHLLGETGGPDLRRLVSAEPSAGRKFTFALGETMIQLCCHGTHHRAQAINMLRRLGTKPPEMDYLVWMREQA